MIISRPKIFKDNIKVEKCSAGMLKNYLQRQHLLVSLKLRIRVQLSKTSLMPQAFPLILWSGRAWLSTTCELLLDAR